MEETPSSTSSDPSWDDQFALALQEERTRIEQFLAAHSERADTSQRDLDEQIRLISEEMNLRHEELEGRRQEVERLEAELRKSRHKLSLEHEEHQAERELAVELRLRLDDELEQSHDQRRELAEERARTKSQRRRIAREFKAQRAALLKEIERKRAELEQQGKHTDSPADSNIVSTIDPKEWEDLTAERDRLAQQLTDTEARLVATVDHLSKTEEQLDKVSASPSGEGDDFQQRYEMALSDLRELKAQNAELQNQIHSVQQDDTSMVTPSNGGVLDWEAEKERILAALEAEYHEDEDEEKYEDGDQDKDEDEDARRRRLQLEQVVNRTDRIVAEKEREIAELKGLLENQSGNLGSMAVGAVALGEMFDKDEIIREERENLRQLQQEWEEKLRQAEIDTSIERAKIARERTEMEETIRAFEKKRKAEKPEDTTATPATNDEPTRGRWLTRLGLKNGDDK